MAQESEGSCLKRSQTDGANCDQLHNLRQFLKLHTFVGGRGEGELGYKRLTSDQSLGRRGSTLY